VTNGTYTFTLGDYAGNSASINHTVNNIDSTAPVVTNFSKTAIEDTTMSFTSSDFTSNYSDAQNTLAHIKIISLPSHGVLKNGATTLTINSTVAV